MSIKYQVFISSTYEDLKNEREQVIKAVLEMGHIPVGMEMFSAADEEQWKIITRQIDDIDYYIVIIAHRYGSVTKEGLSFTEKEYDYAVSNNIPVLGFVISDKAHWPADQIESDDEKKIRLNEFKNKAKKKLVQFWTNKEDLHGKVSISLMKAITANPRIGWAKANAIAGPEVMKEFTRLSSENANLRREIERLLRSKDEKDDQVKKAFDILAKNKTTVYVRKKDNWEDPIESNLFRIFEAIAPNLLVENDTASIANDIALDFIGTEYNQFWPVPQNFLSSWLADFSALELIEPSKKKHSVNDKAEYWSLSKLGKQVLKGARRLRLEQGLKTEEEEPRLEADEPTNDTIQS